MTDTVATETIVLPRAATLGRMTAGERRMGRFMRDGEGHPAAAAAAEPAASAPAPSTAVPVTPPAAEASLIAAAPAATQRPDNLPDAFWDDATGIKPEAYARLAELETKEAERAAALPPTAADYKLDPLEPVLGPDGQPVAADPEDPIIKAALPALHKHGVPQAAISEILRDVLKAQVDDAAALNAENTRFVADQQALLGAEHKARTAAIHNQVIAAIGAEAAEALRLQMRSAPAVIALEALVSKLQGPALGAKPATPSAPASLAERLYG